MATSPPPPPPPQPTGFARWVPSLPTLNLNSLNPFVSGDDGNKPTAATTSVASTTNPLSDSQSIASIMFAEPSTRGTSEADSLSIEDRQRSKKSSANRPKTRYSVCHPPPASSTRQKLHRRPRSLLQLHKLCPNARPLPAFEVIPSASFSVRMTRSITRVFKARHSMCPNDLVVLRAEKYSTEDEDEALEMRDVIGLICKGRKDDVATSGGKAKICMASGQEWEAYPLMNGGYEFFTTDEHGLGLTVRWVAKKGKDGKQLKEKRFNFSTISPNSRRHPVIATLSKTSLEINDTYKMPDPLAVTPLSTPKQNSTILADTMDDEGVAQDEQCETDTLLREIIAMTGVWVTFKEGWSPTFKYDDKEKESAASAAASGLARTTSLGISNSPSKSAASLLSTPPGSPKQAPLEKRGSIKSMSSSILRRGSLLSKGNRASQVSVPEEPEEPGSPQRSPSTKQTTGRLRGDSTSTVLVHRAASNRRKNNQQATWRPDLLDAQQHSLRETSHEDLNRTPPPPSQADVFVDSPATPTSATQRRKSVVAESLLPPLAANSTMETPTKRRGSARPVLDAAAAENPAKRGSTTTTDTNASEAAPAKAAGRSSGKRKAGWRRLFCGSSHDV
ncbi:hypothetical protein LTR36_002415 [Oleoguttula mirabilis]|uniref:Uncharacterized protein n=1 Tax=Oleoguttula mirabilis TaxID=1507867 RepID=A0AAV9JLF8_9PEZI|nr:hypothetical protein LTR36_002415 [Oleoguttula mirabilis]